MTAEGIFPKIGGDPLYFSEANRFSSSTFVSRGSFGFVTSGTDVEMGSVVIPANVLFNPCLLDINLFAQKSRGSIDLKFQISGASNNLTLQLGSRIATPNLFEGKFCIGSPMTGLAHITVHLPAGGTTDLGNEALAQINGNSFANFNPSATTVIKINATTFDAAGSISVPFYTIQGIGSVG